MHRIMTKHADSLQSGAWEMPDGQRGRMGCGRKIPGLGTFFLGGPKTDGYVNA
jgi:hypothetical protein